LVINKASSSKQESVRVYIIFLFSSKPITSSQKSFTRRLTELPKKWQTKRGGKQIDPPFERGLGGEGVQNTRDSVMQVLSPRAQGRQVELLQNRRHICLGRRCRLPTPHCRHRFFFFFCVEYLVSTEREIVLLSIVEEEFETSKAPISSSFRSLSSSSSSSPLVAFRLMLLFLSWLPGTIIHRFASSSHSFMAGLFIHPGSITHSFMAGLFIHPGSITHSFMAGLFIHPKSITHSFMAGLFIHPGTITHSFMHGLFIHPSTYR